MHFVKTKIGEERKANNHFNNVPLSTNDNITCAGWVSRWNIWHDTSYPDRPISNKNKRKLSWINIESISAFYIWMPAKKKLDNGREYLHIHSLATNYHQFCFLSWISLLRCTYFRSNMISRCIAFDPTIVPPVMSYFRINYYSHQPLAAFICLKIYSHLLFLHSNMLSEIFYIYIWLSNYPSRLQF